MLDDFKDFQFIAYSLLVNSIKNDKLSHAYLFDTNRYEGAMDFIISFVKTILCEYHYSNNNKCSSCNLCHRIENGNYPEFKIIESSSNVIKKEQLLELQNDFSLSSIEGVYRIYVIKDCDKMNKQASNSLLKFLEEPVPGVIAILVTSNINKLLSTIISRCQVIRLNNCVSFNCSSTLKNFALLQTNSRDEFNSFLDNKDNYEFVSSIINFIDYFEENGLDTLIYMKKLWHNKFVNRENSSFALSLMLYFYYDVLKFKLGNGIYFFSDNIDEIKKIANLNSLSSLINKLSVVMYGCDVINCNLNLNLLMDDVVIRLGDECEYS